MGKGALMRISSATAPWMIMYSGHNAVIPLAYEILRSCNNPASNLVVVNVAMRCFLQVCAWISIAFDSFGLTLLGVKRRCPLLDSTTKCLVHQLGYAPPIIAIAISQPRSSAIVMLATRNVSGLGFLKLQVWQRQEKSGLMNLIDSTWPTRLS
jgi:hypothetical protein